MKILLAILFSYLFGSIPWGLVIGKVFFHKDIRKEGSGNAGGTNAGRVLGKPIGVLVIALDALKGIIKAFDKVNEAPKAEDGKSADTLQLEEQKEDFGKSKYTYPELTIDQVVDLVYVSLTGYSVSNFEGFVSYHYVKVHTYTYLPNPVERNVTEPVVEVKVDGYPLFTVVGYVPENTVKDYADILRKKLNEKQED